MLTMKTIPLELIHRVRRSAWTLPLAALAALVLLGINEAAYERSTTSLQNLGQRAQARTQIQLVWRALIDAETGQRGYLLTGRKDYLAPYQRSAGSAREALAWLQRYYAGDAQAEPVLAEIAAAADGKLSELSTTVDLHDHGRAGAWRELVLTDIGREKMENVRAASQRLLALETQRVDDERRDVFATVRGGRIGVNAMTALSLLALFLFLRQTLAFDRAQRSHAAALQAEHDRLEVEVTRRTADLTELARHLQTAREDEKSRLARELHDELGALLTAAKLDAARLKRMIGVLTPEVQARLLHLNESINRGIELKRRIIEDLRPSSLSNLGLVAALEILTREYMARTEVPVQAEFTAVELTDAAQITVFRLVQEALTNAAKHAGASRIAVTMEPRDHEGRPGACVWVQDDGRGFDPGERRGTTHGLMGMRYRVEAEGGHMRIEATPGQGTRIEAWLPAAPAAVG
jgi:signal transduction histidine kinase